VVYVVCVNTKRWFAVWAAIVVVAFAAAQTPMFTRPGSLRVASLTGTLIAIEGQEERLLQVDERFRGDVILRTERLSTAGIEFSNGVMMQIGSISEVVVDEYWQQPYLPTGARLSDIKEEPSPSRTLLRLVAGDVTITMKPLLAARGSTFHLETTAGTVRATEGTFRARVQMTDLGIGYCSVELYSGAAEFEPVGGVYAPLPVGRPLAFALELNRATGIVKLGEMPKR
jgi:hypothetical protein